MSQRCDILTVGNTRDGDFVRGACAKYVHCQFMMSMTAVTHEWVRMSKCADALMINIYLYVTGSGYARGVYLCFITSCRRSL